MAKQIINIGQSANDRSGDPLREAFRKVNENFTELYATDTSTKYHLGDDVQFVDIDPESGAVVIQSGFDTSMPVYIKGANCSDEGVGGDVYIEAGGAPLPNNGTTGVVGIAGREVTIDTEGAVTSFVMGDGGNPYVTFPEFEGGQLGIQSNELFTVGANAPLVLSSSEGEVWIKTNTTNQYLAWTFDKNGTLTTPLKLPTTFTATLDPEHYTGEGTLTLDTEISEAWHFEVHFVCSPDGSVETQIDNMTPWAGNPGYADGMEFTFTESDHGIANYTFTLSVTSIQYPSQFTVTTNLVAGLPPEYPSTVSSLGAIKLTSNDNSWTFGTDGTLKFPGSSPYASGGGMTIKNEAWNGTTYLDGNGNDITLKVNATKTVYIEVGDSIWSFGDAGIGPDPILRLPVGGDIVDSDGNSVLGGGGGGVTWDSITNKNGAHGPTKVSIGINAGGEEVPTGDQTVAIGYYAGYVGQQEGAVAIGWSAGQISQGAHSIAIGNFAGQTSQPTQSIIINAGQYGLMADPEHSGFYVNPVRNDTGNTSSALYYNPSTNEITYGPASSGGSTGDLAFVDNAMYNLGGVIVENADLTHSATAALTLPTNGYNTPVQLANTYGSIQITAGQNATVKDWFFDSDGKLILPEALDTANIYRAGNIGIKTDGLEGGKQWTFGTDGTLTVPGAIKFPTGTSESAAIYGNTELIGLLASPTSSSGLEIAGGVNSDLFNSANVRIISNFEQLGGSKTWTFDADGYFNLPGGTSSIVSSTNNVVIESNGYPGGSRLELSNSAVNLVSEHAINLTTAGGATDWTFGADGTLTLPPQAETLASVNDISTAKIYRATSSTDPVAIRNAYDTWYSEETLFNLIVAEDEAMGDLRPWHGMPSWEAYPLILNYNHSGPGLPPPINLAPLAKTASDSYIAYKELESNIDIVSGNKTFSFGNNGILSLPGELTFTDTSKAKIVVGQLEQMTWEFGLNEGYGSLTFPDGSVQTTAYTSTPFNRLVNGNKEVVLGSDGVITLPQLSKISVSGVTAASLDSLETAYNNAESLYSNELTNWITVNSHTPVWFTLTGKQAYSQLAQGNYDGEPWIGTSTLMSRAYNALNAYNTWQDGIANSKLTVKSDNSSWTFDSTNKLTLSKGGVIAGGDTAAIQAAWNDYLADETAWYDLITSGGLDTNIRPWNFAGPTRAEKQAVLNAMWATQNQISGSETLGWAAIPANLRAQVNAWLSVDANQNGYENWKKLTTAVNITSEDKTWSFTNDGVLSAPGELTITTNNTHGGAGYTGFLTLSSTQDGVTNPNKFIRMNETGNLQIVNSAYTSTIFDLSDSGNLKVSGRLTVLGSAPTHSYGAAGDKLGMVAFDGDYIYYCKQDYVDNSTNIWVRSAWTSTNW